MEKAMCLLLESKLQKTFRFEAVMCVYIINRRLIIALENSVSAEK